MSEIRTEVSLLIAFVDLARFAAQSQRVDDLELANGLDAYYEHLGVAVLSAGGTIVKFVGDAALMVFPEAAVDRGVATILALKQSVDGLMTDLGWECRFTAKVHFGTVIAGPFGLSNGKQFDIIGKAVNTAATLDAPGVTLSVEAFRKLGRDLRTRFKKHTPPSPTFAPKTRDVSAGRPAYDLTPPLPWAAGPRASRAHHCQDRLVVVHRRSVPGGVRDLVVESGAGLVIPGR